jgi:small GTP-binding protein
MSDNAIFKVVMLGAGGVGKTSLVRNLTTGSFIANQIPTVGAAYVRHHIQLRTRSMILNVWDTAGQEKFYSLVPLYMRNAHGLIFVFDVSAEAGLTELDAVYANVREEIRPGTCAILCANKIDLVPGTVDLTPYMNWGSERGMELVRTSAKSGDGVSELFSKMASDIDLYCEGTRQRMADEVLNDICGPEGSDRPNSKCC